MNISVPGTKAAVGSPTHWTTGRAVDAAGKGFLYLALVNASGHVLKQFPITEKLGNDLANLGVDDIINLTFDACKSKLGLKQWGA